MLNRIAYQALVVTAKANVISYGSNIFAMCKLIISLIVTPYKKKNLEWKSCFLLLAEVKIIIIRRGYARKNYGKAASYFLAKEDFI